MRGYLLLAPYLVALVPTAASAAAPRSFIELAEYLVTIMNNVVVVLVVLALVIFLYGMVRSVQASKDKGGELLRKWAPWGVLILFVMVSIWGILQILTNTFLSVPSSGDPGTSGGGGGFVPAFTE